MPSAGMTPIFFSAALAAVAMLLDATSRHTAGLTMATVAAGLCNMACVMR